MPRGGRRCAAVVVALAVAACGGAPRTPGSDDAVVGSSSVVASTHAAGPETGDVDPDASVLMWLRNRTDEAGVWTTWLDGTHARAYLGPFHERVRRGWQRPTMSARGVIVVEYDSRTSRLLLLDGSGRRESFLENAAPQYIVDGDTIVAARAVRGSVEVWQLPLSGAQGRPVGTLVTTAGPNAFVAFGLAVSPDGTTIAAGWSTGSVAVWGHGGARYEDVGVPLLISNQGELVTRGPAGGSYRIEAGKPHQVVDPNADVTAAPGASIVAWPVHSEAGGVGAVRTWNATTGVLAEYPASGQVDTIVEMTDGHVLLGESHPAPDVEHFGYLDLATGRFKGFDARPPA